MVDVLGKPQPGEGQVVLNVSLKRHRESGASFHPSRPRSGVQGWHRWWTWVRGQSSSCGSVESRLLATSKWTEGGRMESLDSPSHQEIPSFAGSEWVAGESSEGALYVWGLDSQISCAPCSALLSGTPARGSTARSWASRGCAQLLLNSNKLSCWPEGHDFSRRYEQGDKCLVVLVVVRLSACYLGVMDLSH